MTLQPPPPEASSAEAPTQSRARIIKRRLMYRVAAAENSHISIAPEEGRWQPWLEGVGIKVLHERAGVLSYLLRLQPGATLPPHRHPLDEECLVLEGTLQVGADRPLGAGSYHLAHQGTLHTCISSPGGATLFLRGAVPHADQEL